MRPLGRSLRGIAGLDQQPAPHFRFIRRRERGDADERFGPRLKAARGELRVRGVTLHHAQALAARTPEPVRTLPAHGAERIVAEADGTMVPVVDTAAAPPGTDRRKHRNVRYQEARLVAACAQGSATTHYGATRMMSWIPACAGRSVLRRPAWGLDTQIHALGDGTPWIAEVT